MADLAAELVRSGVLPPDAAARALAAAHDGDVASAALRLGLAEEGVLVRALCDQHGCPGVDLSRSVVPTANLDVVAAPFCRQRRVLPVSVGQAEMVLAMADPEDHALADEVRFVTGRRVLRYAAVPAALDRVLDGLVRERTRRSPAWRGPQAPPLPDPRAAWVGVVHPTRRPVTAGLELPEATGSMEIIGVAESVVDDPFAQPTPARRARAPELAPPAPVPVPDDPLGTTTVRITGLGAGRVALVADASAEAREELAAALGKLGCTALQAANGKAALDVIREARPDVVFLEALLPVVPGFEVCRAVKGDPVLRPTRVVLTSGTHRGTVLADAQLAFGADAALEKPYRAEEVQRVARLLLIGAAGAADPAEQERREAAAGAWRAGAAALQGGKLEEAVALLRDAVAKDDLSAEAQYWLGLALSRSGMLFEAAAAFGRAAELRPDVDAAHQLLAQTYEQLGFQKSAREAWARAIETCRDDARRKAMQARLMALLGL